MGLCHATDLVERGFTGGREGLGKGSRQAIGRRVDRQTEGNRAMRAEKGVGTEKDKGERGRLSRNTGEQGENWGVQQSFDKLPGHYSNRRWRLVMA